MRTPVSFQYPNRLALLMYSSARLIPPVSRYNRPPQKFYGDPVVHNHRNQWPERIEGDTGNSPLPQTLIIPGRHLADGADIIINQAHVHALFRLFSRISTMGSNM